MKPIEAKSSHGGARRGAGRPKGSKDTATREAGATLGELARNFTQEALDAIVKTLRTTESDTARLAAANALLDRGYGKPPQAVDHTSSDGSMNAVPPAAILSALERKHRDG